MRSVRKRYSVISASTITLEPGGVMLAGASAFSRTAHPADVVEVEVEVDGVGALRNHAGRKPVDP
jgi:5-oxopent-3-ene-1,2,5-tricarboxylate decarboxylase / 2-hydroxyhepta-2,4-diene-1,7-dioate isomerase